MSMSHIRRLFALLVLSSLTLVANADERILNYQSHIEVARTGLLNVTETITVRAEGNNIRRGIYRDIPTTYPHPKYAAYGFVSKTPVEIRSVTRNGRPEPFHTESLDNGLRLFIGQKSRRIPNGEHRYVIEYRAYRQLNVDAEQARLYWNVTGNGWRFPIDQASLQLVLPEQNEIFSQQVWTGQQGSTDSNAVFEPSKQADLQVITSQALKPAQGMTVRIEFSSDGLVLSEKSELQLLIEDNRGKLFSLGLFLLVMLFLPWRWWVQGRDPTKRPITARYQPVENLSAVGHRVVLMNKTDSTCFSSAILSLAINGWITIEQQSSKQYSLQRQRDKGHKEMSAAEQLLYYQLVPEHPQSITLGSKYSSKIEQLRKEFNKLLKNRFAEAAHRANAWPMMVAGVIGLIGLVLWYFGVDEGQRVKLLVTAMASLALSSLVATYLAKKYYLPNFTFGVAGLLAGISLSLLESPEFALPIFLFGAVFTLFTYLMPAPKALGQRLIEQIEGFRLYLSKAEHESLQRLSLPEKTPQLYEQLLPYAIALDLETEWSDQFTQVLDAAEQAGTYSRRNSTWYHATSSSSSASSLAGGLAAGLASSVVASSTAPSSSSSSGGGFSGGGGGGGGGGGW